MIRVRTHSSSRNESACGERAGERHATGVSKRYSYSQRLGSEADTSALLSAHLNFTCRAPNMWCAREECSAWGVHAERNWEKQTSRESAHFRWSRRPVPAGEPVLVDHRGVLLAFGRPFAPVTMRNTNHNKTNESARISTSSKHGTQYHTQRTNDTSSSTSILYIPESRFGAARFGALSALVEQTQLVSVFVIGVLEALLVERDEFVRRTRVLCEQLLQVTSHNDSLNDATRAVQTKWKIICLRTWLHSRYLGIYSEVLKIRSEVCQPL